jgi:hypothetical protein
MEIRAPLPAGQRGRAEVSGERTHPPCISGVPTLFGETPNTTRGDAYAPRTTENSRLSVRFSEISSERCSSFDKPNEARVLAQFPDAKDSGKNPKLQSAPSGPPLI